MAGGSKRGWTSWLVGAVSCESCVKIAAITPVVPIVPSLHAEVHRMFQSYDGFTWAFHDFLDAGVIEVFDEDRMQDILRVVDPMTYGERLARIPKMATHCAGDQFMDFTWPNIWYD